MQTPDYNPDLTQLIVTSKPLPALAPLVINPSVYLRRLVALVYLLFLIICVMLTWPHLQVNPEWGIVLLMGSAALLLSWRQHTNQVKIPRCLWFEHGGWFLASEGIQTPVSLVGDVIVWPWVIIITVKTRGAAKTLPLVVMRDAVSEADFRRLSCWLRVCLKPRR